MTSTDPMSPPKPSALAHIVGSLMPLAGVVCFIIGYTAKPPHSVAPQIWDTLFVLLVLVVPCGLFALRRGLLGGPVPWLADSFEQWSARQLLPYVARCRALAGAWIGLCGIGFVWFLSLAFPFLVSANPWWAWLLWLGMVVLLVAPIITLSILEKRRHPPAC